MSLLNLDSCWDLLAGNSSSFSSLNLGPSVIKSLAESLIQCLWSII